MKSTLFLSSSIHLNLRKTHRKEGITQRSTSVVAHDRSGTIREKLPGLSRHLTCRPGQDQMHLLSINQIINERRPSVPPISEHIVTVAQKKLAFKKEFPAVSRWPSSLTGWVEANKLTNTRCCYCNSTDRKCLNVTLSTAPQRHCD